jgi:uncharacterized protein (DUF4415 family)
MPIRPRTLNSTRVSAEAAFKSATTKPVKLELAPKGPSQIPGAKELISLRVDQAVLEFFQADGPGWQERMLAELRKAAALKDRKAQT